MRGQEGERGVRIQPVAVVVVPATMARVSARSFVAGIGV